MASLLITKSDDKTQTVVTINGKGVFFQELRLGNRPMSQRVRIGRLVVVDSEVVVEYDAWNEYDQLLVDRDTTERTIKATNSLLQDAKKSGDKDAIARGEAKVKELSEQLADYEMLLNDHPIRSLTALNAKIMAFVDKMLDKVRYKHKHLTTKNGVSFTHYPTKEYFYQRQAEDLLKRHNDNLESRGIEEGFIDFDMAMAIIQKRYAAAIAMSSKNVKKATV